MRAQRSRQDFHAPPVEDDRRSLVTQSLAT